LAFGLPGVGKSHAMCAVGHALVDRGHAVLFMPTYSLVQDLLAAKRNLELPRALRKLDHYAVLLLDDVGYIQQSPEEAEILFTLLAERYERRSVCITSNLIFAQWDRIFRDQMATAAATVETNGAITPEDAVAYGAALLQEHFRYFVDFGRVPMVVAQGNGDAGRDTARLRDLLAKPIDECGLSVRSINSLKNSSINTLGDLVRYSEEDMLKVKNVGEKALGEIAELLRREGLNFGMEFEESDGNLVVTNPGAAPTAHAGAAEEA